MATNTGTHKSLVHELTELRSRVAELEALNAAQAHAEEQTESLTIVSRLAIELAAAPPDADLLALITTSLRNLTGAIVVGLSLYDAESKELIFCRLSPPHPALTRLGELLKREPLGMRFAVTPELHAQMLADVVRVEKSLWRTFFGLVPRPIAAAVQKAFGIDHFVGLALCHGAELLGTTVLAMPRHKQAPPAEVLRLFAHLAAVSLRRKRAEEGYQKRSLDLERLHLAGQALNTSLQVDQVLEIMLNQIRGLLGVVACSVWLLEPGSKGLVCACAAGPHKHGVAGWRLDAGQGLAGWVAQNGESLLVPDTRCEARHNKGVEQETGQALHSILSVPLRIGQKIVGVLQALEVEAGYFGPNDVLLAESLASSAAIALENARLYADLQSQMQALGRAQAQLVQSAKMAAFGELAAGVAHELNTPLNSVLGYSELLLERLPVEDEARPRLQAIGRQACKARDIVRSLLDFSRQQDFLPDRVDTNSLMQETLLLLRQRLENSGVILCEQYSPDLPRLLLDGNRIKQVFLNLCLNALQAMPGGGRLTLRSECIEDWVVASVSDTGVGIPAENLPRLFEPFFTTRPVGEGMGLGLSVSLGIVQAHGGHIEVESQADRGSTFAVWLPIRPPATDPL